MTASILPAEMALELKPDVKREATEKLTVDWKSKASVFFISCHPVCKRCFEHIFSHN